MKTILPPSTRRRSSASGLVHVFAASEREPLYRDIAQHPLGTVVAANDDLLVEAHFSEPLTAYATGWRDPSDLQGALDFVAPSVPVSRRFEFAQAANAEEFFSEVDDVRAIGADFKRVDYTSSKALGITLNKGLTLRVDRDATVNNPQWQQQAVSRLMRRLLRNEYRRAITILASALRPRPRRGTARPARTRTRMSSATSSRGPTARACAPTACSTPTRPGTSAARATASRPGGKARSSLPP